MIEEEMKRLWKSQTHPSLNLEEKLVREVKSEVNRLKVKIRQRDLRELVASVFVLGIFIVLAILIPSPVTKVGSWIIVGSAILVIGVLRSARNRPGLQEEGSVKERVLDDLSFLRKQRRLLKKVALWYLSPFFIGLTLFHYGLSDNWLSFGGMILITVLAYLYVWQLNQKAIQKELDPAIQRLEKFLQSLEER